jgi:hypothetical protein
MKKTMKGMLVVLFILFVAFVVFLVLNTASCSKGGGNSGDPKSLAKQTYQMFAKEMEAQGQKPGTITFVLWASKEPQELQKLMEKVEGLSKEGQKTYEDELEKLLDEADKKSGVK